MIEMGIGCCTRELTISEDQFVSLTEAEIKSIHHFIYEHCVLKHHGRSCEIKIIDGSIGNGVEIKCSKCGCKEDITDYNSW